MVEAERDLVAPEVDLSCKLRAKRAASSGSSLPIASQPEDDEDDDGARARKVANVADYNHP